jgi:hypothetical protein
MFVFMKKYRKNILCLISCSALLLFSSCSTQFSRFQKQEVSLAAYTPKVVLPAQNIPLPATDFTTRQKALSVMSAIGERAIMGFFCSDQEKGI